MTSIPFVGVEGATFAISRLASLFSLFRDFLMFSYRHLSPKIWQPKVRAGITIVVYALFISKG